MCSNHAPTVLYDILKCDIQSYNLVLLIIFCIKNPFEIILMIGNRTERSYKKKGIPTSISGDANTSQSNSNQWSSSWMKSEAACSAKSNRKRRSAGAVPIGTLQTMPCNCQTRSPMTDGSYETFRHNRFSHRTQWCNCTFWSLTFGGLGLTP